ncbi:PIG-L family deacetylase [Streptomyces sp. NBC_00638]|uniref:PIG-L deacetylase family protein n=1 Tax=unclassified Streptomyces TaxID=2593676 RepID=UPI002259B084|nr:PIG-L family deacetylase [Streptomyces sp. NBC_00638]MCX5008930.1 PIG-L family deacetylase [Streptomyces sp. NBC_00638]
MPAHDPNRPMLSRPSRRSVLTTAGLVAAGVALDTAVGAPSASAAAAPAIFYSPHQDDEAIGLAGSILEHKAAGRPVYLVLVSKGENGDLAAFMNQGNCQSLDGKCSAPGHYHKLGWQESWPTPEVVTGRTAEFNLSAKALGVDKVINFKLSDEAFGDYDNFVKKIMAKVRALAQQYPGASHKFAAGWLDGNPTHKACSDAAYWLMKNGELTDVRFNHIYAYQQYPNPADRGRGADYVLNIPAAHMAKKRSSILAYNTWDPSRNLYTLGYHSVPVWLEQAYADPREFVYTLPSRYRPGPA